MNDHTSTLDLPDSPAGNTSPAPTGKPRHVNAERGIKWFGEGFRDYRAHFLAWLPFSVLLVVMLSVYPWILRAFVWMGITAIPVILLSIVLVINLTAQFIFALVMNDPERYPRISQIPKVLRIHGKRLLKVCLFLTAYVLLTYIITATLAITARNGIVIALKILFGHPLAMLGIGSAQNLNIFFMLFTGDTITKWLLVVSNFAFGLIGLYAAQLMLIGDRIGVFRALTTAASGFWRNIPAFVVSIIMAAILVFTFVFALSMVMSIFGNAVMTAKPQTLAVIAFGLQVMILPWMFMTQVASFRDIFINNDT